ncbi:hypothetical protein EYZ11_011954 [Aspergillus tanneri]|uniref:Uncharacterized protein n=1 Tax=Aspergillus tanneri TaxID=1220188 RepID=A0A4S3J1G9_9EURO|nr:hypothetical protein EYZ11_011954 [Aspergillus tanneri]
MAAPTPKAMSSTVQRGVLHAPVCDSKPADERAITALPMEARSCKPRSTGEYLSGDENRITVCMGSV